jgi:hypothetical protein
MTAIVKTVNELSQETNDKFDIMTKDKKTENEVIEISVNDQKLFDQAIDVCKTLEGRLKTVKHVFSEYIKTEHIATTINEVLELVAHPCIGEIEANNDEVSKMVTSLRTELIEDDVDWWKMATLS